MSIAQSDEQYHDVIYQGTRNDKLVQMLGNLREQMYRYRVEYLKRDGVFPQLIAEHEAIIRHIENNEKEKATEVMCRHIDNQVEAVIDVIRAKHN